jgi:hypothetical protein
VGSFLPGGRIEESQSSICPFRRINPQINKIFQLGRTIFSIGSWLQNNASFKCFNFMNIDLFPIGSLLAIKTCTHYFEILRLTMENQLNKRRAISILAVLGAILVMIATWNPGGDESI